MTCSLIQCLGTLLLLFCICISSPTARDLYRLELRTTPSLEKRAILPNGPTFLNFPDTNYYNAAARGVLDTWRLAFQGLQEAQRSSSSTSAYKRYFQLENLCDVRMVLEAVLGEPGSVGPAMMKDKLTVAFGRPTWPGSDDECAEDANVMSYINQKGDMTEIVLCERVFHQPHISLDQIDCSMIGASASAQSMSTIGSHILHELIHWRALIDVKLGYHVGDWDPDEVEGDDHIPPDGYDPYNPWQLNARGKHPEMNADSYTWFAVESYMAVRCSRVSGFLDPAPA